MSNNGSYSFLFRSNGPSQKSTVGYWIEICVSRKGGANHTGKELTTHWGRSFISRKPMQAEVRILMQLVISWMRRLDDIERAQQLWRYRDGSLLHRQRGKRWRFSGTNVVVRGANCQQRTIFWESTDPTYCLRLEICIKSCFPSKLGSF